MAIDQHFDILRHLLPFKHIEVVREPPQVVSYWKSRVAILIDTSLQKRQIFLGLLQMTMKARENST